jgi:hypothetical protein
MLWFLQEGFLLSSNRISLLAEPGSARQKFRNYLFINNFHGQVLFIAMEGLVPGITC